MKVICASGNVNCENYVYEKEWDIEDKDFQSGVCPICGGEIAPAYIKEWRLPGEVELRAYVRKLYERKKDLEKLKQ